MLPRAAVALLSACLVISCATSTEQSSGEPDRGSPTSADASMDRVVLQAYRAIGDRHLYEPNFRTLSTEAYRGFTSGDPSLSLETSPTTFTVRRDGKEVLSRSVPENTADGRAWGGVLSELLSGSLDASPALQQTDRQALLRQAMTATTKQLDRNSRYADPDEAKDNRFQRDGGGGIGITVERTEDKKIMIRAVQDGSPSSKAGIQIGDEILAIDGESMVGRPLSDVVAKLRGAVGVPVSVTVQRPGRGDMVLAMKRARIVPTTVVYERRGDVALIHLTGFNSATTENLKAAIDKAKAEIGGELSGLIIDMRSNRGGLLDQAQSVSELFIGDGTIFSTNGRHPDSRRTYRSGNGKTRSGELPIVVLMNGGSASAAEIVAAALQDRGRAVIVGTTSYGKGTVQTVVRLANEGELILTWSRLQAPSGYTWNELGVLPNICTAKVGDPTKLGASSVDSNQSTLMRWHAMRNPTHQEVSDARKICPPGETSPELDVEIASRLLHDRTLYAHAVQSATFQAAR